MIKLLNSIHQLEKHLQENKSFIFSSKQKKLSRIKVMLFALATGDFNPAHIVSGYEDKSFFKSRVSHGIGEVARSEAIFLEMVQFKEPMELIASGYESIKYYKPMRLGCKYQYDYSISNLRLEKGLWSFDCLIVCKTTWPKQEVIGKWQWKPCFVENLALSEIDRKMLIPKNYFWNVLKYFFVEPTLVSICVLVGIFCTLGGLVIIALQLLGIISVGTTDMMVPL